MANAPLTTRGLCRKVLAIFEDYVPDLTASERRGIHQRLTRLLGRESAASEREAVLRYLRAENDAGPTMGLYGAIIAAIERDDHRPSPAKPKRNVGDGYV